MDQTTLEILVKLKDEASAAFKKIASNIESGGSLMHSRFEFLNTDVTGFSKVLAGAAIGGGAAILAFLYSSVKAGAEAEAQIARVTATLESMGPAALKNKDAILRAADAAVKLGFDDEDAALSITKFYQRTHDLTEATKLNNVAMDLARAKHVDLATAANLVNMVLSGQGRVLAQYGISIKETAGPLEALGLLQDQVKGQADAFSKTFEGQMETLSVTFKNIKEVIGSALIESLMPFITEFTNWLNNPQTKENITLWTIQFKSWADVIIPTLIETFKIWFGVLKTIYDILVAIGEVINSAIEKAQRLAGIAAGGGGGSTRGAGGLGSYFHAFADGGIVTRPTLAMIGEGGEPEAVIPLSKMGNMGGGNISIYLSGTFFTESEIAERFGNQIAAIVGQQLKIRSI